MDARTDKYREQMEEEFRPAPAEVDSIPPGPEAFGWTDVQTETHPAEPKKRRGRPPKDPNAPVGARKPRTPAGARGRSLKDDIGGTLFLLNMSFAFMPEPWRGDALDEAEIYALADALDDAARANPIMHKYLSTVLVSGGSMANLVIVAGLIAGRRLARHGLMPAEMDERLATFLAAKTGANAAPA